MNIAAFDLSTSCSGYACNSGVGTIVPPKQFASGVRRLMWIRSQVLMRAAVMTSWYSRAIRMA